MARLDFRLVPDLTPEIVLQLLREHLDVRGFKDIEIIELGNAPLAKSSAKFRSGSRGHRARPRKSMAWRRWFIRWIRRVAQSARSAELRTPPTPVASFGISYAGSNPHGPDENIRVDDFLQSIKFIGRVMHRAGRTQTRRDEAENKRRSAKTSGIQRGASSTRADAESAVTSLL